MAERARVQGGNLVKKILFRGKHYRTGKWIYGIPFKNPVFGGEDVYYPQIIPEINGVHKSFYSESVDEETVGQYTGLKDDDGNMIFEGDILHLTEEHDSFDWKALVIFGNPNGEYNWGWQLKMLTEELCNPDILLWVETELNHVHCKIIGNVHDNPELLGGAECK